MRSIRSACCALFLLSSNGAGACTADAMKTAEGGFIFKIVAGASTQATKEPDSKDVALTMEPFVPHFVICEEGLYYKVTDARSRAMAQAEAGKTGYVRKSRVHPWHTGEALNFRMATFSGDRAEIAAWPDHNALVDFLSTGNERLGRPAFRDNLLSILSRDRTVRPYPVLSGRSRFQLKTTERRMFDVLVPTEAAAAAKVVIPIEGMTRDEFKEKLGAVMTRSVFAVAFDATAGLDVFALPLSRTLLAPFEALPPEIARATHIGFVFFRDENDAEKFAISKPQSIRSAANLLKDMVGSTQFRGGGDPAEPVLDAVHVAHRFFPWDDAGAGRRTIVAVLNDDAKPATTGKLDDRVPPGLEAGRIADDLLADAIPVVSVQVGPNTGSNLIRVLTALGRQTGGSFIEWGPAGEENLGTKVATELAARLAIEARNTYDDGKNVVASLDYDFRGSAVIPLASLGPEKLARLRSAGIGFSIETDGNALRDAFIIENSELLEPHIRVDRKTLQDLIRAMTVLTIVGVDGAAMQQIAAQEIAAIAGEPYDPDEPVELQNERRLGLQFRSKLLDADLTNLDGMEALQRVTLAHRIRGAIKPLSQFFEANLDELEKNRSVWMPMALLP